MTVKFILSLALAIALAALAALVCAKPPPTPAATAKCQAIGTGSGCSGCTASTNDCDWCTAAGDDSKGTCLPEGACASQTDDNDVPYVSNAKLCPSDPTKEPPYTGRDLLFAVNKSGATQDDLRFTPHFEEHYCRFRSVPWAVDRSIGRQVQAKCNRVNDELSVGQRAAIDSCLESKDAGLLNERRKECLRLYQSLLCTSSCQEYGVATDYNNLCPSVCARLDNVCGRDLPMAQCLQELALPLPLSCGTKSEDCYDPQLTEAGSRFEYDLCFYGDPKRCKSQDCVVSFASNSTTWPAAFQGPNNGQNFGASQSGPMCCVYNTWFWWGLIDWDPVGFLLKIDTEPTGDGIECAAATRNLILDTFKAQVGFSGGRPEDINALCTGGYCAAGFILYPPGTPRGDAPVNYNGCASPQSSNCPQYFYGEGGGED